LSESDRPYRLDIHRHYLPSFLIEDGRNGVAIGGLRIDDGMTDSGQAEMIEKLPSDMADRVWGENALDLLGKDRASPGC
jgi:hypothetical protein